MSDHFLSFAPTDPAFAPATAAREQARLALRRLLPLADEITDTLSSAVQFQDCGGNFESVACSACGRELPLDLWQDWMEADFDAAAGFRLSPVPMPCCGAQLPLSELTYVWPQAFSRYVLTARNPGVELEAHEFGMLSAILGCTLTVIRSRL